MAEQPRRWTNHGRRTLSPGRWVQTLVGMLAMPELPMPTWHWGKDPILARKAICVAWVTHCRGVQLYFVPADGALHRWSLVSQEGGPPGFMVIAPRRVLETVRRALRWMMGQEEGGEGTAQ